MVQTPPRPKKQRKVRSRADTSMPPTTRTTRSGRRNKPPPPTDGGYLFEGDSTLEKTYTKNDPTPRRDLEGTGIEAWMDDCHASAYQEVVWCMGEVPESRACSQALDWCDVLRQQMDKCDHSMSREPHRSQRSLFFVPLVVVLPGSIVLFWGQLSIPPCMCFCGMPREVSSTPVPLFRIFRTKTNHQGFGFPKP